MSVGDTSGHEWGTDKERRTKENQIVSEFEQAGAGTDAHETTRVEGRARWADSGE